MFIFVHVPSQEIWEMGGQKSYIGVDFISSHCSSSLFRSYSFQGGDKAREGINNMVDTSFIRMTRKVLFQSIEVLLFLIILPFLLLLLISSFLFFSFFAAHIHLFTCVCIQLNDYVSIIPLSFYGHPFVSFLCIHTNVPACNVYIFIYLLIGECDWKANDSFCH